MKPKLILASIVYNEEDWLPLMLKSVIHGVDKVVLVDSGSTDNTKNVAQTICKQYKKELVWIDHKRLGVPGDDGIQRNVYVDYLVKNHINDWCIVLDADEIVKGSLFKAFEALLDQLKNSTVTCLNLVIQHLIGDLGHIDMTLPRHFILRRMFKIRPNIVYPEVEHNMLQGFQENEVANISGLIVWHFAHTRKNAFYWLNKHKYMKKNSNIHSLEEQDWWYYNHLFGTFPKRAIDPSELPTVIKDKFFINHNRTKMKTLISVSTVPGNTEKLLECIKNIEKFTLEDHQTLITNNNWVSFAYAHNKALKKALYDDEVSGVIIISDDVQIKKFGWLNELRRFGENYIVGVKDSFRPYDSLNIKYLAFYCVYIPKKIIKKIGLLDERFKIGNCEDVDYCKRALDAKFNLAEIKDDVCSHDVSHTVGDLHDWREDEQVNNTERLKEKWGIK